MDKFKYIIRRNEWVSLTNDKARIKFIREVYYELENICSFQAIGHPAKVTRAYRDVPEKQATLLLRTLRNCFTTFDTNKLPDYIPATIQSLMRR